MRSKIKFGTKKIRKEIGGLTFGKLREYRQKTEVLSQKDFAKFLGITPSRLCDLVNGRKILSPLRAATIAAQAAGGWKSRSVVEKCYTDAPNELGREAVMHIEKLFGQEEKRLRIV